MKDRSVLYIAIVCAVLGLLCLSLISCASSRTGKALNVGVVVSAGVDLHSTRMAINNGSGREVNPLMSQGALRQAVVKSIGTAGLIGFAHLVEIKGRPQLANVLRVMTIAAWSIIAARNYSIATR